MTVVDIFVQDDALIPHPVVNAVVTVLDSNAVVVSRIATDLNGRAAFDIPDATYEVRIFKHGYSSDVSTIIVDDTLINSFDAVLNDLTLLPTSPDPALCRCTGRFVNFENRPMKGVTFRLVAKAQTPGAQIPKLVDGDLVCASEMNFQTDADGKVSIDLFRGGEYIVVFAGEDDTTWCLTVPDRSSANLIDLIFPAPVLLAWNQTDAPGDTVSIAVGETKAVRVSLFFTDFHVKTAMISEWVAFTCSDGAVARLSYADNMGTVYVQGLVAGAAQVNAELLPHLAPARIPPYSLTSTPLLVNVTP